MSKIIKPKLNADGSQVIDYAKEGDWYYDYTYTEFTEWECESQSCDKVPIYYAEEWRPEEYESYFYNACGKTLMTEYVVDNEVDIFNLSAGNCFQTQAEAEDVNNILKVLNNMAKYYQEKLTEIKNE